MSNYTLNKEIGLKPGAEPIDIICRFERIKTQITPTPQDGADKIAEIIINTIKEKNAKGEKCVLALPGGKTPISIYRSIVSKSAAEKISFKSVVIFTLSEYFGVSDDDMKSYSYNLLNELIKKVDIQPENVHTLNGAIEQDSVTEYCSNYEKFIKQEGGIDIILLGVGVDGQVALNESGSYHSTRTRMVALSNQSRKIASEIFFNNVPSKAITVGLGTIMDARKVILCGWGNDKAVAFKKIIEEESSIEIPGSIVQEHENAEVIIDESAAELLTRVNTPWLVGTCEWTRRYTRKAVVWLCQRLKKPILKLTYQDYIDNYLGQLIDETGKTSNEINIEIFNDLQHTISGWPGGKPNADDTYRPVKSNPFPKRVVIFSPHPDDDVISMGGTFIRLIEQNHDVHVAYQTSGNIAVHDDVLLQNLDTARELGLGDKYNEIKQLIENKQEGQREDARLSQLKGALRRAEARGACRSMGLNEETNAHFLNLPFYETGTIKKGTVGQEDIDIIKKFLRSIKPHQIYAAGDLADPHGTHRVCIEAILTALKQIIAEGDEWLKETTMWLYRGAWMEWDLDQVDMAVPLSPGEVIKKRHAIYRHLSQKDIMPFPGEDKREFWERAEERNQNTARLYDLLGMAEYQSIEVFAKFDIYKNLQ